MKLSFLAFLSSLLICFTVNATSKISNPIFYKVEKNGRIAYILGTIHFRVKPSEMPNDIWKALDSSKTVMVELNVNDITEETAQKTVPPEKRLGYLLPEKNFLFLYSLVRQNWGELIPIHEVAAMDVLTGLSMTQVKVDDLKAQRAKDTLDQSVALRAKNSGKEIVELDVLAKRDDATVISAEDLNSLIDKMIPYGVELASKEINTRIDKMVDDYRSGICIQTPQEEMGMKTKQSLVIDRNKNWVQTIDHAISASAAPIFIAAGCDHFDEQDSDSVLNLLKPLGYEITRLKPQ